MSAIGPKPVGAFFHHDDRLDHAGDGGEPRGRRVLGPGRSRTGGRTRATPVCGSLAAIGTSGTNRCRSRRRKPGPVRGGRRGTCRSRLRPLLQTDVQCPGPNRAEPVSVRAGPDRVRRRSHADGSSGQGVASHRRRSGPRLLDTPISVLRPLWLPGAGAERGGRPGSGVEVTRKSNRTSETGT